MDEQGIETFLCVVKNRNLSAAAEALCLSQSAVSKRLKRLEEALGFEVLHRGKGCKHLQLTFKGEAFLPLAHAWRELQGQIENLRSEPVSVDLRMAAPEIFNLCWISPKASSLHQLYFLRSARYC